MFAKGMYYLRSATRYLGSKFSRFRWVLTRNSAGPEYPFQLWITQLPFYRLRKWLTGRIPDSPPSLPCMRESEPYALYLYPDSIRRWWLLFVACMLTALFICSACSEETSNFVALQTWLSGYSKENHQWVMNTHIHIENATNNCLSLYKSELIFTLALSSLLWFFACYQLVYRGLRQTILSSLWKNWPLLLDKSFLSIPQKISGKAKSVFAGRSARRSKWRQPVRWSSTSPQRTFLKLAHIDLFGSEKSQDDTEINRKWSRGLVNWGVYWCAPVWAGYAWLLLLLFVPVCAKEELPLWIPALIWTILSITYFTSQIWLIKKMNLSSSNDDFYYIPPIIKSIVIQHTASIEVDFYTRLPLSKIINFILTISFVVYLTILQVIN